MDHPRISVVVLNYNKREDLDRNLRRLREIPFESKEVIVVDNASTDGSAEMVREEFPEVTLIASDTNDGVAKGRNRGFRAAQGEYVIYLDDDSVAPVDVCDRVVELFEAQPEVGCLAFLVRAEPSGVYSNQFDDSEYLGNYHGAGHAFRKDCLERIGYLEEMYFFGGEEVDSSLAMLNEGFKTRYTPEGRHRALCSDLRGGSVQPAGLQLAGQLFLVLREVVPFVASGTAGSPASGLDQQGIPGSWKGIAADIGSRTIFQRAASRPAEAESRQTGSHAILLFS